MTNTQKKQAALARTMGMAGRGTYVAVGVINVVEMGKQNQNNPEWQAAARRLEARMVRSEGKLQSWES